MLSVDLKLYFEVFKVVWPIAAWVAWVNHNVKQNRKDIDAWYCKERGGKGMRDRTLRGRWNRWSHKIKDKKQ
jgi:hypothetical protein